MQKVFSKFGYTSIFRGVISIYFAEGLRTMFMLVGWNDIGYTFLVCEDGRVYEGRGWNVKGSHTLGYNEIAIGVCIIGDYQYRLPLPVALNATLQLLACGVEEVLKIITSKRSVHGC